MKPQRYDYLYRLAYKKAIDHIIRICKKSAEKLGHHINALQFELDDLAVISDNDKAKISPNKAVADKYMLQKISKWQQVYHIHSYKQKYTKTGSIAEQSKSLHHLHSQQTTEQKECAEDNENSDCSSSSAYHTGDDDDDEEIRNEWKVGCDEIEVYSHSKRDWFRGKIAKIYNDEMGEWLVVEYDQGTKVKDLHRFDDDLRPLVKPSK